MEFLFLLSAFLIVYVYAGYPVLLMLLKKMGWARPRIQDEVEPEVTLFISAFNEEDVIAEKIENSLALDYPKEKLEILVISDRSDDKTDEIVESYADKGVKLLAMPERGGKTVGLNAGIEQAKGEIIIFSDANAMYDAQVVRNFVRNFADESIGVVTGESQYVIDDGDTATESENAYWRYELAVKRIESDLGSLVGGDGAIYAIRKSLYRELAPSDLSDFVNPLQIVAQGYRNVYEPAAFSVEKGGESFDKEYKRKVRIVNRAWRGMMGLRQLLNPFSYGLFAIQTLSHKLLRWLVPAFMIIAFIANHYIADQGGFYRLTYIIQFGFYLLAGIGWLKRDNEDLSRIFYIPYYFCLINFACLQGIIENYMGKTYTVWSTVREKPAHEGAA